MDEFIYMFKKVQNRHIHLFIIIIGCIINESYGFGNFVFRQKTLPSVEMREETESDSPWWFSGSAEKQQLCHLAKKVSGLAYMDYNIIYNWHYHDKSRLYKVMRCPTLPTIFVVKEDYKEIIEITFLQSGVNDIIFNTQVISEFDFISQEIGSPKEEHSKRSRLAELNTEDRKNLCDEARKFVNVVFLDTEVPEAQRYKFFIASNEEQVHLSLLCPTSPKLGLYRGYLENEVKLFVVRDSANLFTFELDQEKTVSVLPYEMENSSKTFNVINMVQLDSDDRVKLCALAREYASLPGTDTFVQKAETYSFMFEGGRIIHATAIRCQKSPELYLKLASPVGYKMKIIFVQNPFERFTYTIEFFEMIHSTNDTEESKKQIEEHWFSTLSEDNRWKLCHAVQKRVPASFRLETTPQRFVESPMQKVFVRRYPIGWFREEIEDITIRCSGLPETYVRIIQQSEDDEIKVIQIGIEVDYFDVPRLRNLSDFYNEEQDNYDG